MKLTSISCLCLKVLGQMGHTPTQRKCVRPRQSGRVEDKSMEGMGPLANLFTLLANTNQLNNQPNYDILSDPDMQQVCDPTHKCTITHIHTPALTVVNDLRSSTQNQRVILMLGITIRIFPENFNKDAIFIAHALVEFKPKNLKPTYTVHSPQNKNIH